MNITSMIAFAAGTLAVIYILYTSLAGQPASKRRHVAFFFFSLAFLGFSLFVVIQEGPLGFWTEHTRNFWGNQIWFDLLLGVATAWTFMLPRAKSVGMNLPVWGALVLATGCIGLTAMAGRLLYLEKQRT
ncbi:MAG: hypothetical protein ACOY5B_15835 [Spirochaetota bacterium]